MRPDQWDDSARGYLNSATYGLPPRVAWDEFQRALDEWRTGRGTWERWCDSTDRARAGFARLNNVPETSVAVGATVSELVGLVAAGVGEGMDVVTAQGDFASLVFPWAVQTEHLRAVPLHALAESIAPETDVVAVSVVQSATGEVADLPAIVAAAREVGALVVVDATQACGWLPVAAAEVDALACAGYKWLLAPRGTAYLYVGERLRERLKPLHAGWYAGEDVHAAYYGPPMRLAATARRFDTSPAWFSWVGAAPAIELLEEIGVEAIRDHNVRLANRFRSGLGLDPSNSAIVSMDVAGAAEAFERAGIRAATRAGSLRAAFHLYNTEADVDASLEALTS
jgi:selenocysteine lyase/cysteine desulfurase